MSWFQDILKDAVDAAYAREGDDEEEEDEEDEEKEEEEFQSIEKLTPNQVAENRPVQIGPKIIGTANPPSKKSVHFV